MKRRRTLSPIDTEIVSVPCLQYGVPLSPLPPYDPIDWTNENEFRFLNGFIELKLMSRAEFEEKYPSNDMP